MVIPLINQLGGYQSTAAAVLVLLTVTCSVIILPNVNCTSYSLECAVCVLQGEKGEPSINAQGIKGEPGTPGLPGPAGSKVKGNHLMNA